MNVPGGGARPPRPESEASFQRRVEIEATKRGWSWMHVPRSMVRGAWRTQIKGPLGNGFPDLMLVRGGRLMFFELKADRGAADGDQRRVHAILGQAAEVYVLKPRDWDKVVSLLA